MHSNNRSYKYSKKKEIIKWFLVIIILFIPVFIKYISREWIFMFRFLFFVFCLFSALLITFSTRKGKEVLHFIYQSKTEIKKIIWPNRKETFYTTFIVAIVTICTSLILWGLDNILFRLVSFVTNLRL
jgi:preprotein translocase subunit SecE